MLGRLTATLLTIVAATSACFRLTHAQSNAQPTAATIEASCAPWDGPAFEVRLPRDSSAPVPELRIAIWQSPNLRRPSVFHFPDSTQQLGVAQVQRNDGEFELLNGTVSLGPVQVGQPVTGSLRLTRARGGAVIERTFRATWIARMHMCG